MVSPYRFIGLTFLLLASLVSVGLAHGLWTQRWPALTAARDIQDLEKMPLTIGRWEGKTLEDKSAQEVFRDGNTYLLRRYVNQYDGTVATIMLTRGRPGPMLIKHLPTECYVSAGYEIVGQPKRFLSQTENKLADEFWVATFKKTTDAFPVVFRVYWSWSATGAWQTPDRPRFTFARHSMLYKLYVVQRIPDENTPFEGAPVHDLIKELTTAMRGSIFASPE